MIVLADIACYFWWGNKILGENEIWWSIFNGSFLKCNFSLVFYFLLCRKAVWRDTSSGVWETRDRQDNAFYPASTHHGFVRLVFLCSSALPQLPFLFKVLSRLL